MEKIFLGVVILAVAGAIVFFQLKKSNAEEKERKRILSVGIPAKGKVISVEEMKNSGLNEWYRKIKVNMEVSMEGKDTYQAAAIVDEVKVSEVANYASGKEFNLRVDPVDPQKITIEN
jgi:hypothetical protein